MFKFSSTMGLNFVGLFASDSLALAEPPLLTERQVELTEFTDVDATITVDSLIWFQGSGGDTMVVG
jgi:hypothetical protein